jgi:transposase
MTFDGTCNPMLMELWLEDNLRPQLEIGDVIVMDNASFHQGQAIEELV